MVILRLPLVPLGGEHPLHSKKPLAPFGELTFQSTCRSGARLSVSSSSVLETRSEPGVTLPQESHDWWKRPAGKLMMTSNSSPFEYIQDVQTPPCSCGFSP